MSTMKKTEDMNLGEEVADYTFKQLCDSLLSMYDQMDEEEQHAFDLGEMYGLIRAARKDKGR